ncbi:myeloid differentiation primary response protein MyD88-like [Mizuhopecten yessoensis]|uniref:MyD88-2b n=1 Tax=Mizuhopecten yessoensis TaxID=6573 RepID=A0A0H3Y6K7_MIZYE|nr:myeloid differentiation primary response protein MyD88-like [Mizuhopecten yessoensis]XP_021355244.1 myeloid differentiation primary response protein MyD88-like [Mizuhopecten yessoensis]XP_021355253.1 myeloid differentiation primary response protein MyD88-like [Mizuhopecten yessoensis]AKN04687.1 MyD88-2b [Mizuhopecten yessoensis]
MSFKIEVVDGNGESLGLPEHFLRIPLTALRCSVRRVIALHLNAPSEIVDQETGYVNDYNGLAEFIGFTYLEIKHFSKQKSPTEELLEEWETTDDLQPSIGKLWEGLYILGRFDVMKDCQLAIVKDVEAFLRNKERQQDMIQPVQSNDVSQSSDHHVDEGVFLCKGDVENKAPQFFDAFVSYNHDGEDIRFVKDMIKILEGEPHKLKLFIPGRDDLPGAAKYVMDARLIETRCRRMVIILSNNYLLSSACDFQSKFAHALAPGARNKKLIPVIIEPVTAIPEILRYVTLCDYTKVDLQEWFWNRLSSAIKLPLDPAASGWSPGSPMSSTSVGSLSSIASSPDSAIGQSLSSSSDVQMEIPSEESINSDWVDLSSEFSSQSDPEMSLSMSPPAITSSSASSSKGMKSDIKRFFGGIGKLNFGGSSNSSVKDPSPQ